MPTQSSSNCGINLHVLACFVNRSMLEINGAVDDSSDAYLLSRASV